MINKNSKISFAVEDVRVIDERNDSQFAEVEIDVFASGLNKHDLYISTDNLKRTAKTILLKPLVFIYDRMFDDIGSHDINEVPGGFVPSDTPITFRELPDGRTMMTVFGRIWKRYSGDLLSFFKRDGNLKPVSVEMEVYETKERKDGLTEIIDFCYTAVTILGSLVTPAIPGAQMSVVKFAEEYQTDFEKEFVDSPDKNFGKEVKYSMDEEEMKEEMKEEMSMDEHEEKHEENHEEENHEKENHEEEHENMSENDASKEDCDEMKDKEEMEENKEQEESENYSLDAYLDVASMLTMLEDETESYRQVAEFEFARGEKANYAKVIGAMFAKMCKMKNMCDKMTVEMSEKEEKCSLFANENDELKQFKVDVEKREFANKVALVMADVKNELPETEYDALMSESEKFSLDNIDVFSNMVKAKAFEFSKGKKGKKDEDEIVRFDIPRNGKSEKNKYNSSWDRLGA